MPLTRGPCALVIDTKKSAHRMLLGNKVHFTYELESSLQFSEPHLIKLDSWTPSNKETAKYILSADFVKLQHFDSNYEPFLAITSSVRARHEYLPLATEEIPAFGNITFTALNNTTRLTPSSVQGILVFHIIPQSHYGTYCHV